MAERIALEGLYERPTLFTESKFEIEGCTFKKTRNGWVSTANGGTALTDGSAVTINGREVFVRLPDAVHGFICAGLYDQDGNYHPGYFDTEGRYQTGAIWYEGSYLKAAVGYYTPAGDWVTDAPSDSPLEVSVPPNDLIYLARQTERGYLADVAVFWSSTLLDQRTMSSNSTFKVGQTETADLVIEDFDETVLIQNTPDGILVDREVVRDVMLVDKEGVVHPSDDWDGTVTETFGVIFEIGEFTVVVRCSEERKTVGGATAFDRQPVPFVSVSGVAHVLFLLLALSMPDNARALDLDGHLANNRFVQLSLTPDQEDKIETPDYAQNPHDEAGKHAGDEGESGKPDAKPSDNKLTVGGESDEFEIQKRNEMIAHNAGIASNLTSLYAMNDRTIGPDAKTFLGKIDGHDPGDSRGPFGFGIEGDMPGGGGDLPDGIGIKDVGTKGLSHFKKTCDDCDAKLGEKEEVARIVTPLPKAVLGGSLDREIIRRVISKSRRSVKHCYELELQKDKTLAGEVLVKFTISANGDVVVATVMNESTLDNHRVKSCVSNVVRRLVFPAPDNGMAVIVKYPFRFFKG